MSDEPFEAEIVKEREAWIRAHGSPRLRKGLEAGLLPQMLTVYCEERIAHDFPGYELATLRDAVDVVRNPSEEVLDAFTAERDRMRGRKEVDGTVGLSLIRFRREREEMWHTAVEALVFVGGVGPLRKIRKVIR